jgi:hypothetical protein
MEPVIVSIVLDPDFGDQVVQIAADGPVWITSSAANRSAVEKYWASKSPGAHDVTYWSEPRTGATEDEWLGILGDIELHHSNPGVAGLEVYGAAPGDGAAAALREYGYEIGELWPGGFAARRDSDV